MFKQTYKHYRSYFAYAIALVSTVCSICIWTNLLPEVPVAPAPEEAHTSAPDFDDDLYVETLEDLPEAHVQGLEIQPPTNTSQKVRESESQKDDASGDDVVDAEVIEEEIEESEDETSEHSSSEDSEGAKEEVNEETSELPNNEEQIESTQIIEDIPVQAQLIFPDIDPEGEDDEALEASHSYRDTWELRDAYTLSIPSLNIYTNVNLPSRRYWNAKDWGLLEKQMQAGLHLGAVAYPHSVQPGSRGNLIIAGHSSPPNALARKSAFGHLFARLPELQIGETISVLRGGRYVDYQVKETQVVDPHETSILRQQSSDSLLKLITCYPVGTTKERWIVVAEKVAQG